MRHLILCCLLFPCLAALYGQADSIGEWRSLQSFRQGQYVTQSPESIIYTTGTAVFYLDKADLSFTRLTRTDGLGGGRIDLVKYHPPTGTLLIVYANSSIDLYRDGTFRSLPQIDNFNFSGDKRIFDVSFSADGNTVYLAAGYGVSSLDLTERIFNFTTFTGVAVTSVTEYAGALFAGTPEGLYRVPLTGVNVNDFRTWQLLGPETGLPGDYTSASVTTWRDRLYFGVNNDIYRLDADSARLHFSPPARDYALQELSGGYTYLIAGYRCLADNCADRAQYALTETAGAAERIGDCAYLFNNAIEDESGRIWFGNDGNSVSMIDGPDGNCNRLGYPGPPTNSNYRLFHDGESLWVAPGRLTENGGPLFDYEGVFRYQSGEWTVYNHNNTSAFRGPDNQRFTEDDFATVIDVAYDPVNDRHYFTSFFEGLLVRDAAGEYTLYNETNSSLEIAPDAGPGRVRVAGAVTDAAGNTYFAVNSAADRGIVAVLSPEGNWAALGQDCGLNVANNLLLDENGYVWVLHRGSGSGGLTVINPNGTPLEPGDDPPCRDFNTANSALPTTQTRSLALDRDGEVWVGTTEGVAIFTCGGDAFAGADCVSRLPQTEGDGFGAYLLENEEIRSITVDGANRKWLGTNSGAFLLSEDGTEELLHFTRGNSPLLDNTVRDIAIDATSGTVYFGTELGIISRRGDATAATGQFSADPIVFPNPVEPGYLGPIAIDGLATDARVKITDLSGKLVNDGVSNGGRFVWDGNDYNGRRVTTGIYLVFASSGRTTSFEQQQSGTAVAKIVFIR